MDLRPHIGKGFWALFDKSLTGIYGFAVVFLLVGKLPREEYGLYVIAFTIANIAILFNKGFILFPMTKYEAEGMVRPKLLGNTFLFSLFSLIAFSLIFMLLAPILAILFHAPALKGLFWYLPLVLLGFFFRDFSLCYLQAHRRVKAITLIDGVYFLGVALTFAGLNLLGVFDKAIIAIWVHIIFAWLSSIVALFPTLKGIKFDFHLTLKELKTISNFGRYSLSTGIGEIVYYQADLLMLGYLFEPKTVAVYNAGRLLFRFYSLLSQSLNLLLFPGTSSLYAQMRLLDIKSMFEKILAYYWTLMLILNIPLFFGANFLLEVVYSGRYPESVIIFRIFLILSFVEPLYTMSMSVLYGIGKPEKVFQPLMISVPFFIRMNSFLMPLFNGLGAALSFGIMNIFLGIFLLKSLKKEAKISLFNSFNYVKMYPHILRKSWEFLSSRI